MRIAGDFTKELAGALGCDTGEKKDEKTNPVNRVLPRVMVDGPFGSASEDFYKFEVAVLSTLRRFLCLYLQELKMCLVLVGAGIGVTPFASILKSIWYRANYPQKSKPTRLQKVYLCVLISCSFRGNIVH
jgi:hypothetical protein